MEYADLVLLNNAIIHKQWRSNDGQTTDKPSVEKKYEFMNVNYKRPC